MENELKKIKEKQNEIESENKKLINELNEKNKIIETKVDIDTKSTQTDENDTLMDEDDFGFTCI